MNYIYVNVYTVNYLDGRKRTTRIMVAATGVVIAGGLSALLMHNSNWNTFPIPRMGILGASILGAAIPLWIAGKWGSGNHIKGIIHYWEDYMW